MPVRRFIEAIFTFSKKVAVLITDVNAFKTALTSPPGNTYVTIPPATITDLETHLATLLSDEGKVMAGGEGAADARDLSLSVVINDVRDLVRIVQNAADDAPDEETAIAIIHGCGLKTRAKGVHAKPDLSVKNDNNTSGLLHLLCKAADKGLKASYEWANSTNGVNFTTFKVTPVSRLDWQSNATPGTKMYFRVRISLSEKKGGTQSWSQVVFIIIT